jgi:hypothetical protein
MSYSKHPTHAVTPTAPLVLVVTDIAEEVDVVGTLVVLVCVVFVCVVFVCVVTWVTLV